MMLAHRKDVNISYNHQIISIDRKDSSIQNI
jgi:hypothetical protein